MACFTKHRLQADGDEMFSPDIIHVNMPLTFSISMGSGCSHVPGHSGRPARKHVMGCNSCLVKEVSK